MALHFTKQNSALIREFIAFRKQLDLYLAHFPKHEKFALANRMRNAADDAYDYMTEAMSSFHKKTSLSNLDKAVQRLRMQVYLAFELGLFRYKDGSQSGGDEQSRMLCLTRMLDSLGALIGAWIKSDKNKEK